MATCVRSIVPSLRTSLASLIEGLAPSHSQWRQRQVGTALR
jgi:hypothetical protein